MSTFRALQFDALLSTMQIISVQSSFYTSLTFIILIFQIITGAPLTLSNVIKASDMDTSIEIGWMLLFANLLNVPISYYLLMQIISYILSSSTWSFVSRFHTHRLWIPSSHCLDVRWLAKYFSMVELGYIMYSGWVSHEWVFVSETGDGADCAACEGHDFEWWCWDAEPESLKLKLLKYLFLNQMSLCHFWFYNSWEHTANTSKEAWARW